jgi:hypothetical protein
MNNTSEVNDPVAFLGDKEFCGSLDDVQFNYCIQIDPQEALTYEHVCIRMSDAQFNYCVKEEPVSVLEYGCNEAQKRLIAAKMLLDNWLKQIERTPYLIYLISVLEFERNMNPYQKAWFNIIKAKQ